MQFIDLGTQFKRIEDDLTARVLGVLQSQRYIMGPEVQELEGQLADYVGVKHALSCSSGTDALVIPLMAYGLTEKDAVFVPSFTFFASAESVTLAGGTPVFVDSESRSFNVSPSDLERAIEKTLNEGKLKPRGIMSVDLFGLPADYQAIKELADKYELFMLEDAAQGLGGIYKGKKAGSLGNVGATSFFPAKPLGCYGDGGAIFTDDDELAELMKSIRVHGQGSDKYDNVRIGVNGRLDSIQAAVLLSKLEIFEDEISARNDAAVFYTEQLRDVLTTPKVEEGYRSAWAQYTLQAETLEQRDRILTGMKEKGIPVMVYYPIPIHLSTAYLSTRESTGSLPVCENLSNRVFSLPMHPYLDESTITSICDVLKGILHG